MTQLGDVTLVVWEDVEPAWEEEFNNWYNQEQLPERVVLGGCLGARRFVNSGDFEGPKYLAIYEFSDEKALASEASRLLKPAQTPWGKRIMGHVKRTWCSYRHTFSMRGRGPLMGTGLSVVWGDVEPGQDDEFNRWYDREHLIERIEVGYLGARRFERIEGTGQKYIALYELPDERIIHTEPYKKLMANPSDWTKRMQGKMKLKRIVARLLVPQQPGLFTKAALNAWRPAEGIKAPGL